jgi:DNA-binding MarR family transcriptional regulator
MNDMAGEVTVEPRSPPVGPAFLLSQVGAHAANTFAQMLSVMELQPQHAGVLRMLGSNAGMTQKGLSDLFGIFPSRLVVLLDELERKNFIQRRNDPADRRNYRLHLTAAGRRALKRISAVTRDLEDELFASLNESELKELTELLERIVAQQKITRAVHPAYRSRDVQHHATRKERQT